LKNLELGLYFEIIKSSNYRLQGFESFLKQLEKRKFQNIHAVMEATGKYGEFPALFLYKKG